MLNLNNDKSLVQFQTESICRQQNKCDSKVEICVGKGRKYYGKRKYWLPAFSPIPLMFFKSLFVRVVKSRDCVVKGQYVFTVVQIFLLLPYKSINH